MKLLIVFPVESILVIVFDTIVFVLTIARTWQLYKEWRSISSDWQKSLSAVLLHDGVFYHSCVIGILLLLAQEFFTIGGSEIDV